MMEQYSENDSAQTVNAAATLGASLREARERLGLSVADVANQIKFAPRQIEALEADDFKRLPETAFLRGFIRSYAKILQLDAQKLLEALPRTKEAAMELAPASVNVPFPDAQSLVKQNLVWLGAAALLAVITAAFALWNFMSPVKPSKVVQVETPVSLPTEVQIIPDTLAPDMRKASSVPDTSKDRSAVARAQSAVPATKAASAKATPQNPAAIPAAKSAAPLPVQPIKTEAKPEDKPEAKPEPKPETSPEPKPEAKGDSKSWWSSLMPKFDDKPVAKAENKTEIRQESVTEVKPAASPQAQAEKSATPAAKPSKNIELRLEFGEESWTEIKDRDGKIISSQVNPRGTELIVNGRAPFTMLIGHGLSVRLYREGKPVDLAPYINKYSEVAHVTLK